MQLPWQRKPDAVPSPAEMPFNVVDEAKVAELDEKIFIAHRRQQQALRDRLLDQRNAIRPARPSAVPVIPGRSR